MARNRLLMALAAGLLALPALAAESARVSARAEVSTSTTGCESWPSRGLEEGPVAVGFYEADFATGRRACPRTEIGLGGRGGAIIDTPNFYGAIAADALLFGSLALTPKVEVFGALEVVHWQFVQNATLKGSQTSLGQATLGGSYVALDGGGLVITPSARLMLPTSTATPNVRTVGIDLGAAATYRALGRIELHGYLGADLSLGLSAGPALPRLGAQLLAGVQYSPWDWLGLVLDVSGHFGSRAALDYVAPALAFRFRIHEGLGAELGGTLPVLGADRHDAIAALKLTYRL